MTSKNECDPCKYDGETTTGEFWCLECREFLCGKCRKHHLRQKFSRNHKLIPASEVPQQYIVMTVTDVEEPCLDHKEELLKVHCIDHKKMCCVLCQSTTGTCFVYGPPPPTYIYHKVLNSFSGTPASSLYLLINQSYTYIMLT